MRIKLDEKTIRDLPLTQSGQQYYFDTKQQGFGLCVGQQTKTFFLQRHRNNRLIRIKIGRHGDMSCMMAREAAQELAVQIQRGINPNQQKREQRNQAQFTVQALYEEYALSLKARGKHASCTEYPLVLQRHLSDWLHRSAQHITREMVVERHQHVTHAKGPAIANRVFTILSGIYEHAASEDDHIINPVKVLTSRKLWNKTNSRTSHVKPTQFEAWFTAAKGLPNSTMRLFLIFQLLNGLRKTEGMCLRWQDVDFHHNSFTIHKTKNGHPLTLPITSFSNIILRSMQRVQINEWVFPSKTSASGHIINAKRSTQTIKDQTGLDITVHDLRRSFASVANALNISHYTIKKLLNHSMRADVTAIYIPDNIDNLRQPLESIQAKIIEHSKTDINNFLT